MATRGQNWGQGGKGRVTGGAGGGKIRPHFLDLSFMKEFPGDARMARLPALLPRGRRGGGSFRGGWGIGRRRTGRVGGVLVQPRFQFFHAAHRLRFTLADLGLKGLGPLLGILCYGGAIVGTLIAGAVALGLL
jgi:hypothetical protein